MNARAKSLLLVLLTSVPCGCAKEPPPAAPVEQGPPPTNRVRVPEVVRQNLGIQFVRAERRRVAATLRLPGLLETLPEGRREYPTALAGRVTLRVGSLQPVAAGDVLYSLDAPAWREQQRELADVESGLAVTVAHIRATKPLLAAHQLHESSLREALALVQQRIRDLEATQQSLGGQTERLADARVQAAQVQAQVAEAAEQHTATEARIAELEAAEGRDRERLQLMLAGAAAMLGQPLDWTTANQPAWRGTGALDVRATAAGIVQTPAAASGAWLGAHEPVLATIDPSLLRCRARALQSDLVRLRDGLPAAIVPPGPPSPALRLDGALQLATEGDPRQRTLDLFVVPKSQAPFARPGVAVFVEIETSSGTGAELAIPRAAVLTDGLDRVFFRRDPNDPDQVIRVTADLGVDDGTWVEVKSGLGDGDEVVLAGAYELVLASSAGASRGGHFHADGTWHADDHR